MRKAAAAVGVAAAITAGAGAITYINYDGGGSVYGYVEKYDGMYRQGVRAEVNGPCYSSCTMALAYPNICFDKNVILGFHPAYTPYVFGLFSYRIDPQATQVMRDHYPADALEVINRHQGLVDHGGWFRPEIRTIKMTEFPPRYLCPGQ